MDAEALQQIKEQRAKAKAGQHHTAVASALAGAPGAPASDPSQPRAAQQPRSVSLDGGPSAARHISVPAAALAAAGGGSGYGLPPADTAAVAAAALAAAGGIGAYPVPQPQLQLQQGYPSSPAASPPGVGTLSPCGSAQLGPLLRPMRSLPANFSPQLAGASMPPHPFAQQHQGGGGGGGGVQQGGMDAAAAAALPPPFAELLPSLSVQELLSLKSAVEALLLQHVSCDPGGAECMRVFAGMMLRAPGSQARAGLHLQARTVLTVLLCYPLAGGHAGFPAAAQQPASGV